MAREQDARSVAASAAVASTAALKKRVSGLQVRLHTKLDCLRYWLDVVTSSKSGWREHAVT